MVTVDKSSIIQLNINNIIYKFSNYETLVSPLIWDFYKGTSYNFGPFPDCSIQILRNDAVSHLIRLQPVSEASRPKNKTKQAGPIMNINWDQIPLVQSLPLDVIGKLNLSSLTNREGEVDKLQWKLHASGQISSKSTHLLCLAPQPVDQNCWQKLQKFGGPLWFTLHSWQSQWRSLNTRSLLATRGLAIDPYYHVCDGVLKSNLHMLREMCCSFNHLEIATPLSRFSRFFH